MNEIRVAWNVIGRRSIADEPIQGGLWHPDTAENRETLIIVMESGNESYGPESHWIEERQAQACACRRTHLEHNCELIAPTASLAPKSAYINN